MAKFLSSSRYKSTPNYQVVSTVVTVGTRKPIYGTRYYMYTAKENDTFDLIATRALGDPSLWWTIADLNPHVPFPDQIPLGTSIRIPRP